MLHDALIVGGGIAGLTAAAYLSQNNYKTLLFEKEAKIGGLVNSFHYMGFTFDGGIRAIENSGIVTPMLNQLGIPINFLKNKVSIGIENDVIHLNSKDSILDYQNLLNRQFSNSISDIEKIISNTQKIMNYMDVLYGIDNPLFFDIKKDKKYLFKTILPWLLKYIFTINKIQKLNYPVDEYLHKLTNNPILIDMIAQHFFQKTPTFFALSYFRLYLDYQYPQGGTGVIAENIEKFIHQHKGEIIKNTKIIKIEPSIHQLTDEQGKKYNYKKLIWAADMKNLYQSLDLSNIKSKKIKEKIMKKENEIKDKHGGESVFTLYLMVNLDRSYFENICGAHFFYTPEKKGLFNVHLSSLLDKDMHFLEDKEIIFKWLKQYYRLTTYEISFPALRDEQLAPEGKMGLIISSLFDFSLVKHIHNMGWYNEFKEMSENTIIDILNSSIFPGIKDHSIDYFSSTPLTLEEKTNNTEGAITGWAFTNDSIPAVNQLMKIASSVLTPIPDIYQAGQWTFSPSGLPISILTGKLAADQVSKKIEK